ncbi:MAG: hypothetical protein AAF721_27665 [Myxococcota bacterium]
MLALGRRASGLDALRDALKFVDPDAPETEARAKARRLLATLERDGAADAG